MSWSEKYAAADHEGVHALTKTHVDKPTSAIPVTVADAISSLVNRAPVIAGKQIQVTTHGHIDATNFSASLAVSLIDAPAEQAAKEPPPGDAA